MLARTRARLANEAATWRHAGLIDERLAQILAERYDAHGSMGVMLLKWLGFFGIFMLASAIVALVGVIATSAGLLGPAVLIAVASGAVWWVGASLSTDARQRYPVLGAALLTVGLLGAYGALMLFVQVFGGELGNTFGKLMLIIAAMAFATAYRFHLRWPLLLGLLLFFHAVGSWHAYAGHGAYFADIVDKRLMALVALCAIGFGMYHESKLEEGGPVRKFVFEAYHDEKEHVCQAERRRRRLRPRRHGCRRSPKR